MKTTSLFLGLAVAFSLAPTQADAQPGGGYYGAPPPRVPGGFHDRMGRVAFGFQLGLGYMKDDFGDIECTNCDSVAVGVSGHIGGFLSPRFALLFELQANAQTLQAGEFADEDVYLTQSAAMVAAQYWVTPQLWLKGGLGLANLQVSDAYEAFDVDNGFALMAGLGYELFSARNFAVDLQGRIINGAYEGIDNNITSGTIGVGINWY
ncbi:MAG: outer membrane beta-barrel protein [Kofleriaceae bacterium]